MKASIELDVTPFAVPNTVFLLAPIAPAPAVPMPAQWNTPPAAPPSGGLHVPLNQIDAATLGQMCDQFRRGVFKAAGKDEPPTLDACATLRARAEAAEAKLRDINAALTELTPWETGSGVDVYDQDTVDAIKELL